MDYKVKTEIFEGPLDLLLSLIEKRKLYISDISLAKVADDFLAYTQNFNTMPVKDATHFLFVASTLVLIKSKSLLPSLALTEEEESDIADLELRLKIYQHIKEAADHTLRPRFGKSMLFIREPSKLSDPVFTPDKHTTRAGIRDAVHALVASLPKPEVVPETVIKKVISLEEMIDRLADRMRKGLQTRFSEFSGRGKAEKVEVIVSFLAMLELVKQGMIDVAQHNTYAEIDIASKEVATPRYE